MSAVETMRRAGALAPSGREERPIPPPLENGARLTRAEFHRRYEHSPEIKKAELVEGVVYLMSSPVSLRHGKAHAVLGGLLSVYVSQTPGTEATDNTTLVLDNDNETQPDIMLRLVEPATGARTRETADGYVVGPPELVVEVAVSSASLDLGDKFRTYQRNGIQEYLVWRVQENRLDGWELVEGAYQSIEPDPAGTIESRVFPGLRLAAAALLAGDHAAAFAELQAGLASEAHREFVARLAERPA